MAPTQTPSRRRWTVRTGTTGMGTALFEVYAGTMEEARGSVTQSAAETEDRYLQAVVDHGFTVHAGEPVRSVFQVLSANKWIHAIPAPDLEPEPALA